MPGARRPLTSSQRDVSPYVDASLQHASKAYDAAGNYYERELHPRLKNGVYNSYVYSRHTLLPTAHKHYFTYGHPHVKALWNRACSLTDDVLVKYGFKKRSTYDAMMHGVKKSFVRD